MGSSRVPWAVVELAGDSIGPCQTRRHRGQARGLAPRNPDPDAARPHPGTERADPLVRGRARSERRAGLVPDRLGRHRPDAREDARGPRRPPHRRPHRLDHAGPPARARHQPLRCPGLRDRRHVDRTAAVVRMMDSIAPPRPSSSSTAGCARARLPARRTRSPAARRALRDGEHNVRLLLNKSRRPRRRARRDPLPSTTVPETTASSSRPPCSPCGCHRRAARVDRPVHGMGYRGVISDRYGTRNPSCSVLPNCSARTCICSWQNRTGLPPPLVSRARRPARGHPRA